MKDTTYRTSSGNWNPIALLRDIATAWRLLWDPRVPFILKMLLPGAATLYWFSILDLMPGIVLDDIAIMILALRAFVQLAPQEAVENARYGDVQDEPTDEPMVDTTWRRVN